jgi:hypothetical protein
MPEQEAKIIDMADLIIKTIRIEGVRTATAICPGNGKSNLKFC